MEEEVNQMGIDNDDEDTIVNEDERKRKKKKGFFTICKEGIKSEKEKEKLKKYVEDKEVNVCETDDNQWNALQWAVVNNHPEVVKIVFPVVKRIKEEIQKIEEEKKKKESQNSTKINELEEDFKKPDNPALKGEYSPIHWSAYKGFDVISSILIRAGCNYLQVDGTGNTALHQACASNNMSTFKLFMGLGIDLDLKNARSHTPIDLVHNKSILDLIKKCLKTHCCTICNTAFDFDNKRFICSIKEEIICKNCCVRTDYYETEESESKDAMDCRCVNCKAEIDKVEKELRDAIKMNVLENIVDKFNISKGYKICQHLKKEARLAEDKLRREKQIKELVESLKVVENHKTITKSVTRLFQMLNDADENKVDLDPNIIQNTMQEIDRLNAERDLRKDLDNITVDLSCPENLEKMKTVVQKAEETGVANEYIDKGKELITKITKNLSAKELLQMFTEYPIREYPEVEVVDPKSSIFYYI